MPNDVCNSYPVTFIIFSQEWGSELFSEGNGYIAIDAGVEQTIHPDIYIPASTRQTRNCSLL